MSGRTQANRPQTRPLRATIVVMAVTLVTLLLLPNAVAVETGDVSPDGVELHDLMDHSRVWDRVFWLDLPLGWDRQDAYDACRAQLGRDPGILACLASYMVDLHWEDRNGDRIGTSAAAMEDESCADPRDAEGIASRNSVTGDACDDIGSTMARIYGSRTSTGGV